MLALLLVLCQCTLSDAEIDVFSWVAGCSPDCGATFGDSVVANAHMKRTIVYNLYYCGNGIAWSMIRVLPGRAANHHGARYDSATRYELNLKLVYTSRTTGRDSSMGS